MHNGLSCRLDLIEQDVYAQPGICAYVSTAACEDELGRGAGDTYNTGHQHIPIWLPCSLSGAVATVTTVSLLLLLLLLLVELDSMHYIDVSIVSFIGLAPQAAHGFLVLLPQGSDVKEVAAAAQQVAAAAAEAHRNIHSLWTEVGQLRGRQGQMDRRLDDLWQVKVGNAGVTN